MTQFDLTLTPKFAAFYIPGAGSDILTAGRELGAYFANTYDCVVHILRSPEEWSRYEEALNADPLGMPPDALIFDGFKPTDCPGLQPQEVYIGRPEQGVEEGVFIPYQPGATHQAPLALQ